MHPTPTAASLLESDRQLLEDRVTEAEKSTLNEYYAKAQQFIAKHQTNSKCEPMKIPKASFC